MQIIIIYRTKKCIYIVIPYICCQRHNHHPSHEFQQQFGVTNSLCIAEPEISVRAKRFGIAVSLRYCWWLKSCTTKDDDYPIIYRVLTLPGGCLGFQPSTVSSFDSHQSFPGKLRVGTLNKSFFRVDGSNSIFRISIFGYFWWVV